MFDLIIVDENGGEAELVANGHFARMHELLVEMIEQADDDGYSIPPLRIQPAS